MLHYSLHYRWQNFCLSVSRVFSLWKNELFSPGEKKRTTLLPPWTEWQSRLQQGLQGLSPFSSRWGGSRVLLLSPIRSPPLWWGAWWGQGKFQFSQGHWWNLGQALSIQRYIPIAISMRPKLAVLITRPFALACNTIGPHYEFFIHALSTLILLSHFPPQCPASLLMSPSFLPDSLFSS